MGTPVINIPLALIPGRTSTQVALVQRQGTISRKKRSVLAPAKRLDANSYARYGVAKPGLIHRATPQKPADP